MMVSVKRPRQCPMTMVMLVVVVSCTLLIHLTAAVPTPDSKCDATCLTCSNRYPISAQVCDDTNINQQGWSLSTPELNTLQHIKHADGCVGYRSVTHAMEVISPCSSATTPTTWFNSTLYDCQQFNTSAGDGTVGAGPKCYNNEHTLNGCLDIKSKVGPGLQLTKCYHQPNDKFTFSTTGRWSSEKKLPTYPQRCMQVDQQVCTRAGCCTSCPPGRHLSSEGFCTLDAPPAVQRTVYVFLAITSNATAVDEAIAELKKHRSSFTGVAFQYLSICGEGNNDENRCSIADAVGPAHLAPGNMGGNDPENMALAGTLPLRLRKALGEDLEVVPMISFGGTTNVTMLHQLFNTPSLTNAFIADALTYAKKYNITGFNWDLEPTSPSDEWMEEAQGFLAQFTAAMHGAGFTNTWDSNGYEGVTYNVDTWVDMSTYYAGELWKYALERGIYGVSDERFGLGYCPTCQTLTEAQVDEHFTFLQQVPGKSVQSIWLWSFYGTGIQPPLVGGVDVWSMYWPHLEVWLKN